MAGEPDSAAGQAADALRREVAALTLENARLARENEHRARENARLSGALQQRSDDLRQSGEYQAAIGEVLAAISHSTVDLAPLLQTLTDTALRLCEAEMGFIVRRDGETFLVVTAAGTTPEIAADAEDYRRYQATRPIAVDRGSVTGRVALAGQAVQIPDIAADPEYRLAGATQLGKIRTQVGVPLVREGRLVGVLILSRQRVEPFSERQVGLLRTFADQAVIAMENARLLGELRESLDQQTATGDVLRTISRSSTDLVEVLETLVATVARLCRGDQAYLFRREGNLHHLLASAGLSDEARDYLRTRPFEPSRGNTSGRATLERRTVHIPDVLADPEYTYDGISVLGFRSSIGIPLMRGDTVIGVFVVARMQVAPFSDKEIELASGFADQAVIAIENARLFEELNDRQAELRVTLDNTGDGVVMFDADFHLASWNRNFQEMLDIPDAFVAGRPGYDDYLRLLVGRGELGEGDPESIVADYRARATRQWSTERTRPDGRIIEVRNNPVPDGGAVLIYSDITERKRAEAEIAAARDAAEEALEQQTATAEVLKVIASSPNDVQPVFDVVVKAAVRLCGAQDSLVVMRDGSEVVFEAHEGPLGGNQGDRWPLVGENVMGRAIIEGRTIHVADTSALGRGEFERTQEGMVLYGFKAIVAAPLMRNGSAIGALLLRKREPGPFTPRQIELLETFAAQAVIAIENVRLFNDLRESLEQRTATAEILRAISESPTDVQPVLDAVVKAAVRFCGATDAMIQLRDGDSHIPCAHEGPLTYSAGDRRLLDRSSVGARATLDGRTFHFPDVEALDPVEFATTHRLARQHGFRAFVVAPLMREDTAIGTIVLRKVEPGAFTPQQIQLLETFAAQAVIAIENVRLFTELRESLEQQTATAQILQAIAQSPTDVQPVLEAVAKAAVRFCGATDAAILLRDGDALIPSAHDGPLTYEAGSRRPLDRSSVGGRAALDGRTLHVPDADALDPVEFVIARRLAREHGFRAALATPLKREGATIGTIILRNVEPGPFTPQQIQLLETFAAQAVIAIENVRLFTELKESLDQQTATAEILKVIASSPTDVQPVLDAVAKAAVRFCGAPDAMISLREGDERVAVAHEGILGFVTARFPLDRESGAGRSIVESRTIHLPDIEALDPGEFAATRELAARHGFRASLNAPLLRDGVAIGSLGLRKPEPGPFTPQQIQLLETFAAQAVIAIENVRLFTELRESLDRQTATAEVLAAINASPGDLAPVFETILQKAHALGGVAYGSLQLYDGQKFSAVAMHGIPEPLALRLRNGYVPGPNLRQLIEGAEVAHFPDIGLIDDPQARATVEGGIRTVLAVPLRKEGLLLGQIVCARMEVLPFVDKEIALLQNFAAQAVIAMENARLLSELRDALEQQTATADILKAIASSPTDVQPVLDAVARAALRFCGAPDAVVWLRDGDDNVVTAHEGTLTASLGMRRPMGTATFSGQAMLEGRTRQVADVDALDATVHAGVVELARQHKWRASAAAPMMHGGKAIGCVVLRKPEPGLLSPRQIALLETFAAQAVIAIENVRLFTELNDSLERQTATADILKAIASSPTDVQPVLDAVAKAAVRFCGTTDALIQLRDGDTLVGSAHEGPLTYNAGGRRPLDRSVREGRTAHFPDMEALDPVEFATARELARQHGFRAAVATPLKREGEAIGNIVLRKVEPGPFTPQQIELLETFAAQAVIAIENVRLFTELRQRTDDLTQSLERQTATADILKVIASSPADTNPAFGAIAESANRLLGGLSTAVWRLEGDAYHLAAFTPTTPAADEALKAMSPLSKAEGDATVPVSSGDIWEIADTEIESSRFSSRLRDLARLRGYRSILFVPLMVQGTFIGFVSVTRREPGAFRPDDVQLLKTFADQAVIAIQNARLFNELSEALEQQTATGDILKAIASSPTDVQPVLDAVAKAAVRFCGTTDAIVHLIDGNEAVAVAHEGPLRGVVGRRRPIEGGPAFTAILLDGRTIHYPDVQAVAAPEFAKWRQIAAEGGFRALAGTPLLREGVPIGSIGLRRVEPGPFTPQQIELLKTFAAQAVIAIENVRLFTELNESLEQQTATGDILKAIASSPTDVQPVLDAVAKAAVRFCGTTDAIVHLRDGSEAIVAAHEGPLRGTLGRRRPIEGDATFSAVLLDGQTIHYPDVQALDAAEFAPWRQVAAEVGWRAFATAPLLREGTPIGSISLRRVEPGSFTPQQIELLKTFAAQAVIAIENVRLFTELSDALEQQTATADILGVISRSPTDVQPVLEAVTRAALRFCGAPDALVLMRDGDDNVVVAHEGTIGATIGLRRPIGANFSGQALLEGRTLQIADVDALDPAAYAGVRALARQHNWRSSAAAPMMHGGKAIGLVVLRKPEPGLLSPRQIALLETFAAQAVIAIENVRLFTELNDSLERQTATADILKVIASSPTDVQPVLDAVAKAAIRFCDAPDAIVHLKDGNESIVVAHEGPLRGTIGLRRPIAGDALISAILIEGRTLNYADVQALPGEALANWRRIAAEIGFRGATSTPLLREGIPIGFIGLRRIEASAFTPQQIEMLEAFAAQAVIAIENVRLFTELRESLDQQSATSDILKVIASSPTDVQPVLDAVAKAAVRFCGAPDAIISLREGDEIIRAAHEGAMPIALGRLALDRSSISGSTIIDGRTTHIPDMRALDHRDLAASQTMAASSGTGAVLAAPMLREGVAIGCILLIKTDTGPFAAKQIELLEAFAAQAVIAIENVRLFTELRDALDQQTATAEILRVISQSPTDVNPVLAAVVKAALKFCGARDALVSLRDGDTWFIAAHEGPIEATRGPRPLTRGTAPGRAMVDGVVAHVADLQSPEADDYPEARAYGAREGFRAVLAAPLLRDNVPIGAISLRRPEPGAFTANQVDLLRSFAAQAVIAIENVRLFTELRDSLERLRAAQANLIQSEKMASLGQLTAGIAHEIKNPLNFVNNFAALSVELLDELKETADAAFATLDADTQAEVDETMALLVGNLGKIAEHGKRADGIVRSMLSHSRGGSGDWASSDINSLVEEALNLAYHGARAQDNEFNVTLERDLEKNARPIELVPQDVTRVFLNLIGNGFYAVGKRRKADRQPGFRPTLKVTTRDLGEAVEVRVRDNGTGIPPDIREKLFQPFFTTKPTGEGTGLGLSISYDIVTQQHGGTIEVESEPGSFTEFTVRLPRRRVQTSERA